MKLPPLGHVGFFRVTAAFFCFATSTELRAETFFNAWGKTYSLKAVQGESQATSQFPHAVAVDSRGNVFVTGHSIVGSSKEFYTAKYDSLDGHLVWERRVGSGGTTEYIANAVAVDKNDDCLVTGSRNVAGAIDYYTIKYSGSDGTPVWNNPATYNGTADGEDTALKVAADSAGNVIVTGRSSGNNGNPTGYDIVTIKYNGSTGAQIGSPDRYTTAGSHDDVPTSLAVDGTDIFIGGTAVPVSGSLRFYVRKLNVNMVPQWSITPIDNGGDGGATAIAVDQNHNLIATGIAVDGGDHRGFYTAAFAGSNGSIIWQTVNNLPTSEDTFDGGQPTGVAVGPDNNPIVTGFLTSSGKIGIRTIKYQAGGFFGGALVVWDVIDPGSGLGDTFARALATDAASDAIIVGETENKDGDEDFYVAKYEGVTGGRAFGATYAGTFGSDDKGIDVKTDQFGNVAALGDANTDKGTNIGLREFVTLKFTRFIEAKGDELPDGTDGIPDNAVYSTGGAPAVNDSGTVAAKITATAGAKKIGAILVQGPAGGTTFPAVQGQPAPSPASGSKFASFTDPLIESNGKIAFAGKMTGVPASQANGVWTDMSGALSLALQQGKPVVPAIVALPEKITSVMSLNLRSNNLVALVKVAAAPSSNTVLLSLNSANVGTVLLRTGADVTVNNQASKIKSITVLSPAKSSPGDGRWHGTGIVVAKAGLLDGRTVLYRVTTGGTATPMLFSEEVAGFMVNGATPVWKTFGLPAMSPASNRFAAVGTFLPQPGKITAANDTALVASTNGTDFGALALEGSSVPNDPQDAAFSALKYAGFSDPLINSNGGVAFLATLQGKSTTGANNRALLFGTPSSTVHRVVRTGDPAAAPKIDAPGTAEPATKYAAISAFALPSGTSAGPIFVAKLTGAANAKNNMGLFAVASDGVTVRRLLRTGDHLGDQTVKSITLLKAVPKDFGAARSFNNAGSVVVSITFTNLKTALLQIGIP